MQQRHGRDSVGYTSFSEIRPHRDHVISRSRRVSKRYKFKLIYLMFPPPKHNTCFRNLFKVNRLLSVVQVIICFVMPTSTSTFYDILGIKQSASADDGLFSFFFFKLFLHRQTLN